MPIAAALPSNEGERLESLRDFEVLDTEPEVAFDKIARLAADLFDAPIALVSLVDADRQWFKARCGLDASETPRDIAFCAHAIHADEVFYIPDATADPRFMDSPLVLGPPHIRTYAGAPLIVGPGIRLGTLCTIFDEVTALSQRQLDRLRTLASLVVDELDLRKVLSETEEARRAAQQAEAAKSRLLAVASHEIRTPMNGILGMAEHLCEGGLAGELGDSARNIRTAARSLTALLNDVLDLARLEADAVELELAPVAVADLVSDTHALWGRSAADKGLKFTVRADSGADVAVVADRLRVQQIINNLVGNALKFTAQGCVDVVVQVQPSNVGGHDMCVEVRDTGIGISREQCSRLFEPFAQADVSTTRRFGGTGLGLSICMRLVECMDGKVSVASKPGHGATFRVSIPVQCQTFAKDAGTRTGADAVSSSDALPDLPPLSVLVADDNEINRQVAAFMLAPVEGRIDCVGSGAEALVAVKSMAYDIVLMDIHMPVMDGLEATAAIRALPSDRSGVPIVAMTADGDVADTEKFLDAGMNAHVTKPLNRAALLRAMANLLPSASG